MNNEIPGTRARNSATKFENDSQEESFSQGVAPQHSTNATPNDAHVSGEKSSSITTSSLDKVAANPEKNIFSEPNFNPARRELFQSILPSLGQSLVKLLRTSNNLKREVEEIKDELFRRK